MLPLTTIINYHGFHSPQDGEVRFLICTDVAARGIDIHGIPYVINMTLPDDKQNYIHRIGRVGRRERMGLAISLVSKVKEKVRVLPPPPHTHTPHTHTQATHSTTHTHLLRSGTTNVQTVVEGAITHSCWRMGGVLFGTTNNST